MKGTGHEVHLDLLEKGEVTLFHLKGYIPLHQGVLFHLVGYIHLDDPFLHLGTDRVQPLDYVEGHRLLCDTEDALHSDADRGLHIDVNQGLHFDVDRGLLFDTDRGLLFDVDRGLPFGVDHDPLCGVGQGLQVDSHQCDTDQSHLLDVNHHSDIEHHLQRDIGPLL